MSCGTGVPQVFTKDPNALLDYIWDWTAWLGEDEIIAAVFTADPGIVVDHSTFTAKTATGWLSGGTANQTYKVSCRITTVAQRIDDRTVKVFVVQL